VGLSRYHLLRVFKQSTGLPPHAWRAQRRVHMARRLLSSGMSITDAALESGFADQSHLSHWFKRMVGTTPRQYLLRS
jgi:AraC-like DNA-binding protein